MAFLLIRILFTIFFQVTVNAFMVAFTSPHAIIRLAGLPVVLLCVISVLPVCLEASGRVLWAALLGAHSISFAFQYVETVLLAKWSFDQKGPLRRAPSNKQRSDDRQHTLDSDSLLTRVRFGYFAAVTTRNVGTPFEIKRIPRFSEENPAYVPSKTAFLIRKASILCVCLLIIDLFAVLAQPEQNAVNFDHRRIPWTDPANLSTEALIIRTSSVLGFWINLYCIIQVLMGSLALCTVALNISEPKQWPPGFGSVSEAYTMRRFWNVFWHRYQQQKMSGPANFIIVDLLRIQAGTYFSRYAHLFLTFLISGIIHALQEKAQGLSFWQSGAVRFFVTQVFGIILEDIARMQWMRLRKSLDDRTTQLAPAPVSSFLGYVWVLLFLVWSTPAWIYPSIAANTGGPKDMLLPFSVIGSILRLASSASISRN